MQYKRTITYHQFNRLFSRLVNAVRGHSDVFILIIGMRWHGWLTRTCLREREDGYGGRTPQCVRG